MPVCGTLNISAFVAILSLVFLLSSHAAAQDPASSKNRLFFPPGAKEPTGNATPKPTPTPGPIRPTPAPPVPAANQPETPTAPPPAPEESIRDFFTHLMKERVSEAYRGLVRGTIIAYKPEDVKSLEDRTGRALDSYGLIEGFDLLSDESVGGHLRRLTYLSINSELPLRWRFYFYKSRDAWRLVDLRVDDGLVELFEDSLRR